MITRRAFIEAGSAALMLAGCSQQQAAPASENESQAEQSTETPAENEAATEAETEAQPEPEAPASGSNILVLYFSHTGENYNVGVIDEGNTAIIAKMVAERTGADLFEIVPVEPYPEGYDECCDVALAEKNAGARPAVEAMPDISGYSTVFLGFPCWWGDLPMPVYTVIENLDWNGKTVCPFNTHEGSGEAGMFSTVEAVCGGSTVTAGLTMRGQDAQNDREGTQAAVDAWLGELGL